MLNRREIQCITFTALCQKHKTFLKACSFPMTLAGISENSPIITVAYLIVTTVPGIRSWYQK